MLGSEGVRRGFGGYSSESGILEMPESWGSIKPTRLGYGLQLLLSQENTMFAILWGVRAIYNTTEHSWSTLNIAQLFIAWWIWIVLASFPGLRRPGNEARIILNFFTYSWLSCGVLSPRSLPQSTPSTTRKMLSTVPRYSVQHTHSSKLWNAVKL